ncbi:MAG: PspC family transcriptional regulator [Bacteroidota bacterium]
MVDKVQQLIERQAFGVCTEIGKKMGISISTIRLYFIYASFLTFGSPVIVYLGLAFFINLRQYIRRRRSVWDF